MPAFSIAICDDLETERASLAEMVQSYVRKKELSINLQFFSSGESLLAALQGPEPIHLLFLDIYMPGLSGVETARRIRAAGNDLSIIFATTSQDHGLESFEVRASDYLVKPFQEEDVSACLDWFFAHIPESLRLLSVYSQGVWQKFPISSIRYIDVYGHQSRIHTYRGTVVTRRGLDDLESAINSPDFLRCHRSFLVNLNHVERIEGCDFRMLDQTLVPISSANLSRIRSRFIDWTYIKAWSQT
jgi:DNA-binding LytR/AlgR family response regulator